MRANSKCARQARSTGDRLRESRAPPARERVNFGPSLPDRLGKTPAGTTLGSCQPVFGSVRSSPRRTWSLRPSPLARWPGLSFRGAAARAACAPGRAARPASRPPTPGERLSSTRPIRELRMRLGTTDWTSGIARR